MISILGKEFEMSKDRGASERLPRPSGPLQPRKPLERPWPTPTPGVPFPVREENRDKILKQILDKLVEIEKRLESIEKLLAERQT